MKPTVGSESVDYVSEARAIIDGTKASATVKPQSHEDEPAGTSGQDQHPGTKMGQQSGGQEVVESMSWCTKGGALSPHLPPARCCDQQQQRPHFLLESDFQDMDFQVMDFQDMDFQDVLKAVRVRLRDFPTCSCHVSFERNVSSCMIQGF